MKPQHVTCDDVWITRCAGTKICDTLSTGPTREPKWTKFLKLLYISKYATCRYFTLITSFFGGWDICQFLVATKWLYKRVCLSIGQSVGPPDRPLVTLSLFGPLGATYSRVCIRPCWCSLLTRKTLYLLDTPTRGDRIRWRRIQIDNSTKRWSR